MNHPLVQSHRGGGASAPENTLESFKASWQIGAIPEADLRTTKDGIIVAFHDADFSRVVKGIASEFRHQGVQDVTFEQLASFDVGLWAGEKFAGQRVCRIEEIFDALCASKECALYLDIKNVDLQHLAALVAEFGVTEQIILAAPHEKTLQDWRSLIPQSEALIWMGIRRSGDETTLRNRIYNLQNSNFHGITQLQIHVEATQNNGEWIYKPSLSFLQEMAELITRHGVLFQTLPWDCSEAEVYRALIGVGCSSFASDYPEVALNALGVRSNSTVLNGWPL